MTPGQKLVAQDGYEVCLFPCQAMYVTQGEHDVLALDFGPRNTAGQRISPMPCYAPFTGTVVYTGNDHNLILQSDRPVHLPNGTLQYARVLVAHSFTAPTLHAHYNQGDLFYNTGNYGLSSGEHLHMEIAATTNTSDRYWNTGGIGLYKAVHMWDGMWDNNTVILNGGGFSWLEYQGGVTPPTPSYRERKGFKWVLYSRLLRHKRITQ